MKQKICKILKIKHKENGDKETLIPTTNQYRHRRHPLTNYITTLSNFFMIEETSP